MMESPKTYVKEVVTAELRLKGTADQLQVHVLNGHRETLEKIPVQMELQSLNGSTKVKINAYTASQNESNQLETIQQKMEASETNTTSQNWSRTSCGYFD